MRGGIVDFRRKYPSSFRGKKIYFARKYLQYSRFVCQGKKFYHQEIWGKNSYRNQITHIRPPSKVKWSAPKVTRESRHPRTICHFDVKQVCLEPLKRTTYTDFVAKNEELLSTFCNNLICWKTALNRG